MMQFSKSYSAAWNICARYAVQKESEGRGDAGTLAAREGHESHILFYGLLDGTITDEEMVNLASSEKVIQNVRGLVANFPYWEDRSFFHHEISFGLDLDGNHIYRWEAPIGGTIDLLGIFGRNVVVIDLKTGQVHDDVIERHLYVLAVKQLLPTVAGIIFIRLYPLGIQKWLYFWSSKRSLHIYNDERSETAKTLLKSRGHDPLLKIILDRIEETRPEKAKVKLGDHCTTMFGVGCPYVGTICPAAQHLPATVSRNPVSMRSSVASGVLSLPPDEAPGAAFLAIHRDIPIDNTPEINSLVHEGVRQVRAGANAVNKQLMERAKESGPYAVGDAQYGWRPDETVDVAIALRFLINHMPLDEVAKYVSISASSLRKVSEKRYPGLREKILAHCVAQGEREKFGKIKEE